ncbi:hypothetical protein [Maribacter sp. R77961]|uniref:hypothetical protein n=1 Tax=Maribacter sp. R77961 TaxID=3093871 RepID=UPI0037C86668
MKKNYIMWTGVVACSLLFLGCGVTQSKYQRSYNKVWKEMIQSQAWKDSFKNSSDNEAALLYASTEDDIIAPEEAAVFKYEAVFEERYKSLVSRAYFKIITEAEKADARIAATYRSITENEDDEQISSKSFKTKKEDITKRYKAHRAMLEGLKSWNIFSENRTGDLSYFKAENRSDIKRMMTNGEDSEKMVNFLVYKLADLYHVEE